MAGHVGRPPVPAKVHFLGGNPSKKSEAELRDEFSPDIELPAAPEWVHDVAAAEYARLGAELVRYRIVSALDRGVLTRTACCWGRIVWLEERIAKMDAASPNGDGGHFFTTSTGYRTTTPEYNSLHREDQAYMKFCNELGLTPAARSRVKAMDSGQLALPGMGDETSDGHSIRSFAA